MKTICLLFFVLLSQTILAQVNVESNIASGKDYFPLIGESQPASVYYDSQDPTVVHIVANLFADDVKRVTDKRPNVSTDSTDLAKVVVIIGTIEHNQLIAHLIQSKKINVQSIRNGWERFIIETVAHPFPGVDKALVIAGSDGRGTAYGTFTVSRAIGVSPWYWWADVPAHKSTHLYIAPIAYVSHAPSVKYRGFFINDEDWGIRPWAAKNMDKDLKDIGPKTYRKVFELMLRLKANYLWPAMHPGTKAFWYYKENPKLARDYDIVMGSSHHEPMLRDTEWEWNLDYKEEYGKEHGPWRYDINRDEIYRFFDDRVKESVQNPAIYTIGMRATKDGPMKGPQTAEGKIKILEKVIHDQRQILANRLQKPASEVPQVFCPYKEVLELYKAGLKVPDDVTILWTDDNFGYIRQLPDSAEQKRSGGSGVYYHLSYWGDPQDYLWLSSSSPALISYEMSKAYAMHARNIWVFNVGDIKPAEMELEFGLDLAWNIHSWTPEKAYLYPGYWASKTFGEKYSQAIERIKSEYYKLAASGKPEHLNVISYTSEEVNHRLEAYQKLISEVQDLGRKIPTSLQDAYFELIVYPVEGAAYMNQKILYAKKSLRLAALGDKTALNDAEKAKNAYEQIQRLTRKYNTEIAGGKWNGMMDDHPRNGEVFEMPKVATPEMVANSGKYEKSIKPEKAKLEILPAGHFLTCDQRRMVLIHGLGVAGEGLTVWPLNVKAYHPENITQAPYADYRLSVKKGRNVICVRCLPGFPLNPKLKLRYALSVNQNQPEFINIATLSGTKVWAQNVLRGFAFGKTVYDSPDNESIQVRIYFADPGLVVNSISVETDNK